jgi:hypothetical protein
MRNEKIKHVRIWELITNLDVGDLDVGDEVRTILSRLDDNQPDGNDSKANTDEQETNASRSDNGTAFANKERSRFRRTANSN